MQPIKTAVQKCLEATLARNISDITDADSLIEAGMDSISFIRFIVALEEELDFTVRDSDLLMENFLSIEKTVEKLLTYNIPGNDSVPSAKKLPIVKCIVLDCDNVLWGGIAADEEIELGRTEVGMAYQDFQRELLDLNKRGVLLALCSKNDEQTVYEIFAYHPEMLLKLKNITAHRINWQSKHENLVSIANELNLGLDSFLFVDDSNYEINLMRKALPNVQTLKLNPERVYEYVGLLLSRVGSMSNTLTGRAAMYSEQKERELLKTGFVDMDTYHKSLNTVVTIEKAKPTHIARISEISMRTNQFNLTDRRYSEDEILSSLNSPAHDIFVLHAQDRFGDLGHVCVVFVRYDNLVAHVEAFYLSCRTFGRSLEQAMLDYIMCSARKRNCTKVIGHYLQTEKNQRFAYFWTLAGFTENCGIFEAPADMVIDLPDIFEKVEIK